MNVQFLVSPFLSGFGLAFQLREVWSWECVKKTFVLPWFGRGSAVWEEGAGCCILSEELKVNNNKYNFIVYRTVSYNAMKQTEAMNTASRHLVS